MVCGPPTPLRTWRLAAILLVLTIAATAALTTGASAVTGVTPPPGFTADCTHLDEFEAEDFDRRPEIDNKYHPIIPGIRTVFEGTVDGVPHRVEFTVTDLTKVINGVRVLTVHDVDVANAGTPDEEVAEAELSFWAQDDDENVWNMGEYPEEFENGEFVGAPRTWLAGVDGAEAGIHMRSRPRVSPRQYIQGFAPAVEFFDCAKIVEKGPTVTVPAGTFTNTVTTWETNLAVEGDGVQSKTHAPWVGIVSIGAVDPPTGEVLELTSRERLTAEEMDALREEALALDARGYEHGAGYAATTPAEQLPTDEDDDQVDDWDEWDERDGRYHRRSHRDRDHWNVAIGSR
jgi:hypothetical protein